MWKPILANFSLTIHTFPKRYAAIGACCVWALPLPRLIRFNRDVRPILADKCYTCHGPDKRTRRSPLLTGSPRLLQSRCC